ncbi:hypothetical protein EW146_g10093, partial [Bondarzewia mesenterica]
MPRPSTPPSKAPHNLVTFADLGDSVPQVPVQFFLEHILPPLRRGLRGRRLDTIIRNLKGGPRPAISQNGRWGCFPSDPLTSSFTEENTFRPLVQVIEAICTAATRYLVGWDPTIAAHEVGGKIYYDYTVQSAGGIETVYRTKKILSDIGADALRGRGTRVWEAVKLEGGKEVGEPVALKDVWIDHDRMREGNILEVLRKSALAPDVAERLEDCLLTVECHGDVIIGGSPDHTRDLMMRGKEVKESITVSTARNAVKSSGSKVATGSYIVAEDYHAQRKAKSIKYHPKIHYRIVFKEVCESLFAITSLSVVFHVLSWATIGLSAIHQCGWVHRDISIGNILVLNGRAKISDLEYAKKVEHDRTHDVRTGTAAFMPVETASQCYQFVPKKPPKLDLDFDFRVVSDASRGAIASLPLATSGQTQAQSTLPPYKYNPLHDLESIWWAAVYFVVNKAVMNRNEEGAPHEVAKRVEHQRKLAISLFYSLDGRANVLGTDEQFNSKVPKLHTSVRWMGFDILEHARSLLVKQYMEVEKDLTSITETAANGLHIPFFKLFLNAAVRLENDNIEIGPLRDPLAITNARRESIGEPHRRRVAIPAPSTRSGIKRKAEDLEPDEDGHDEGSDERSKSLRRVSTRSSKRAKSSHRDVSGGDVGGASGYISQTRSGIGRSSVDRRKKDRQSKHEVQTSKADTSSLQSAGKRKRINAEDDLDGEEHDGPPTA